MIDYKGFEGLQKILNGQISLNVVKEVINVDKLDEGNICGRRPLVEDNLPGKTIFEVQMSESLSVTQKFFTPINQTIKILLFF